MDLVGRFYLWIFFSNQGNYKLDWFIILFIVSFCS